MTPLKKAMRSDKLTFKNVKITVALIDKTNKKQIKSLT